MIIIRYAEWSPQLERWREKLESLVTAHRFEQDGTAAVPELEEHGKLVQGVADISAYLRQLEQDINDWRAPGCGV